MNLGGPEMSHSRELSAVMKCSTPVLSSMTATSHTCLLNIYRVTGVAGQLNFQNVIYIYLIKLIKLIVN